MTPFHKGERLTPDDALVACPGCGKRHHCNMDGITSDCIETDVPAPNDTTLTLYRCKDCSCVVTVVVNDDNGAMVYMQDRYTY